MKTSEINQGCVHVKGCECFVFGIVFMACLLKQPAFIKTTPVVPLFILTSSSSGSSLHVSVCGTVWPSNQLTSWLFETAHGPHGSPSSFSFHGGPNGSHAACGVTQCARSGATREKENI